MREIRAPRAWLKEHERMVAVLAINWDTHGNMTWLDIVAPDPGCPDPNERAIVEIAPSKLELMWPTGLRDKNGTEIFDSDLLINGHRQVGIVEWSDGCWGVDWQDGTKAYLASVCEFNKVIGNKHQNPDLLEAKSP